MQRVLMLLIILAVLCCVAFRTKIRHYLDGHSVFILKNLTYKLNDAIYPFIDSIETNYITRTCIPDSLKHRLHVVNVPGLKNMKSNMEKCTSIMAAFCEEKTFGPDVCRDDLVVFDVLSHRGAYFPQMHTDIEWNKITNDGFQVWCLEYNNNKKKIGNMFLFENKYLEEKYATVKYFIRPYDANNVVVVKHCYISETPMGLIPENILEVMPKELFLKTTTKYYLDFEEGDCMVFDTNFLHMSDFRDKSNNRRSFNFRLAIKNSEGDVKLDPNGCGYVHTIGHTLKNPTMYQAVE